jgi:hypothetical protein
MIELHRYNFEGQIESIFINPESVVAIIPILNNEHVKTEVRTVDSYSYTIKEEHIDVAFKIQQGISK